MRYDVILADPAWEYGSVKSETHNKLTTTSIRHYPSMKHERMAALDVQSVSKPDCTLFMWTTAKMLPESLKLIGAWGFRFSTVAFVWEKTHLNTNRTVAVMSMWTHSAFEFLLVAKNGRHKRVDLGVHQHIRAPRLEHSRKPEESYVRIERLMGKVRYLEMFSRRKRPGWDVWGNGVRGGIRLGFRD